MKFDKYQKNGAYHYDWYDDPNYAWYKECVDRCVEFCKGETLDLGCGEGLVSQLIYENGFDQVGIDNSHEAVSLAHPELDIRHGDIENDIFAGSWEYLCCLNVIEHLKSPQRIIDIINGVITKGAIIITDKATDRPGRYHEHEYTKEELLDTFKEFKPKYFEINSTEFGKPIAFIGVEIRK